MKRSIYLICVCIFACMITACGGRKEAFVSPNKENRIIVKYDFVSRPSIEYNGDCIWKYPGSGFNEEAYFRVEWIDDNTFKFIYDDESHSGKYAEEYEIVLKEN